MNIDEKTGYWLGQASGPPGFKLAEHGVSRDWTKLAGQEMRRRDDLPALRSVNLGEVSESL